MAQKTIFYSWQSDLPNGTNRTFIESCLNKAIKELQIAHPQLDPCLDRDTANVPGSPDISATIFDKIDNCSIFVCDVSIVMQNETRFTPNPNVLIELGYAVKRLGWDRVVCIANTHFGKVELLPFDVRQRRVKNYALSGESTDRAEVGKELTGVLCRELELIFATAKEEGERLQIQFGDVETKTPLGKSLEHDAVHYSYEAATIPDYKEDRRNDSPFGAGVYFGRVNRDYNRQRAEFIQRSFALRKVAFVTYNGNPLALNDVTLEIAFRKASGLFILDHRPRSPSTTEDMYSNITPVASHFARPGKLKLNDCPDRYEIRVEFGKVQAEANAWSDPFYIGVGESCSFEAEATLFADELSVPKKIPLMMAFRMATVPINSLTRDDLEKLRKTS